MRLTEESLTEAVLMKHAGCADARLRQIMDSLVRHVHAFLREVELTPEEWSRGIRFLTETGRKCNESRQEFILLSDVLGVSMLVDAIANRSSAGATESTVLGPFHEEGAPAMPLESDLAHGPGPRVSVAGRVRSTRGEPIADAQLDVWQAAPNGLYHMQDETQARFNLCGKLRTDAEGRYGFRTAVPVPYPIPTDGPVGELLGQLKRDYWRPAHIHVSVSADGYRPLVTQLFTARDPRLETDPVFAVKRSLIVEYVPQGCDAARESLFRVDYDFILEPLAQSRAV